MPAALQLQIQGSSGDFAFDVEGEWTPRIQPVYKAASNPPQLEELLHVWEFQGCRIVPSNGTTQTLWIDVQAFLARFEDRDNHPTYVRLVRDPGGADSEVLRLDSTTYEGLRFDLIEGAQDPDLPAASWSSTATFTLEVSATRKLEDANGIVTWSQEVRVTHQRGQRILEWDTTIRTAEGTSALDKAKQFAAIDISTLPTYAFQTNGADGIDYEILDADEQNSRTPTLVQAISRVREFNVVIGATGGGTAPDEVFKRVTTLSTPEETITTTFASAQGPNAEQWVLSQRPGGSVSSSELVDGSTTAEYAATWEQRRGNSLGTGGAGFTTTVVVTLSGGRRRERLRSIAAGLPPIRQRGSFLPYLAEVSVTVRRQGGTGLASELPLPKPLPAPWILDPERSTFGEPSIVERSNDSSQHVWERRASLFYMSSTRPTERPSVVIARGGTTPGYVL